MQQQHLTNNSITAASALSTNNSNNNNNNINNNHNHHHHHHHSQQQHHHRHNNSQDNNSSESTSSTETLKWLGSMSDVSVASHNTNSSAVSGSGIQSLIFFFVFYYTDCLCKSCIFNNTMLQQFLFCTYHTKRATGNKNANSMLI